MSKAPVVNTSQERLLKIMFALKGHAINGLSNADIASAINDSKANVSRTLDTMIAMDAAIRHEETGRFSLSRKIASLGASELMAWNNAESKMKEAIQRITAGANQ